MGLESHQQSRVQTVSGEGVPHGPLVVDLCEDVRGVLQQQVKDAVRQLHLHKQLVLVIVDPLGLLLMELLDLKGRKRPIHVCVVSGGQQRLLANGLN